VCGRLGNRRLGDALFEHTRMVHHGWPWQNVVSEGRHLHGVYAVATTCMYHFSCNSFHVPVMASGVFVYVVWFSKISVMIYFVL